MDQEMQERLEQASFAVGNAADFLEPHKKLLKLIDQFGNSRFNEGLNLGERVVCRTQQQRSNKLLQKIHEELQQMPPRIRTRKPPQRSAIVSPNKRKYSRKKRTQPKESQ